jgi:putative toxin-antitoxin system antitoxin component (TIGR02293 family)
MTESERIIEILGGTKALGLGVKRQVASSPLSQSGFRFSALLHLKRLYDLSDDFAQRVLAVSQRTWARRNADSRLSMVESDRLYRLARMIARTEETFGSRAKAGLWLKEPNRALGMQAPLSLLDTDEGAKRVEDVLIRVEHGVFS